MGTNVKKVGEIYRVERTPPWGKIILIGAGILFLLGLIGNADSAQPTTTPYTQTQ